MIGTYRLQQPAPADSGLSCLLLCSWKLGNKLDPIALRTKFAHARGPSPAQLVTMAAGMDLLARPVRCELSALPTLSLPAILQWGQNRFVVLDKLAGLAGAKIFDPANGWKKITADELDRNFSGIAIEISPMAKFRKREEKVVLSPFSLLSWSRQNVGNLTRVLILSILVQVYTIFGPLYSRIIIDEVVPNNDLDLLNVLLLGFCLLALFNAGVGLLRDLALQQFSALMGWDMTRRLFRQMIRLPLPWFQTRTTADVLQKFASMDAIKNLFISTLTSVIVDGFLTIASFTMLMVFTPILAVAALAMVAVYVLIRLMAVPINKRLQSRSIDADIIDRGNRMDTVRAIQTIKAMANEDAREANWTGKFAENVQTTLDSNAAQTVFTSMQTTVTALAGIVIFYIGARQVLDNHLTIGMLTASLAYQGQFTSRAGSLFEKYIAWRMMDVHLSRVADIALAEPEANLDKPLGDLSRIRGEIELKGVSFRYSQSDLLVLNDISLVIKAGEHVALTGRSGIGKSTLVKIICGLYAPTQGSVLLDGKPISHWGPRMVRNAIGTVLQNDELLFGSIAENVAFFDAEMNLDRVWSCLEAAGIRDEIERMPLREHTFVGDWGMALSGGQKQRIFLARALYKQPRLLILDEATSHLDVVRESGILKMLRELNMTVVLVAHRPETIAAADRVLTLTENGMTSTAR